MKEGDLILVSAEATGLGKPMEAVIDKIETFNYKILIIPVIMSFLCSIRF